MNNKLKITTGAVIATAVIGLGISQSSAAEADPKLSTDEIRNLVSDQYPGTITEMELEKDANKAVYEVEITGKDKEYDLRLDGSSGEVLHLSEKALSGKSKEDSDDDDGEDGEDGEDKADESTEKSAKKAAFDMAKAEKIALKEFDGDVTGIELDQDDGRLIYDVEARKGKKEAEIEIDALTEEVIAVSIEQEDSDDQEDNDDNEENE